MFTGRRGHLFHSDRRGSIQIWRDGSEQEQVTSDEFNYALPHISPDGKQMVMRSYAKADSLPSEYMPVRKFVPGFGRHFRDSGARARATRSESASSKACAPALAPSTPRA